MIFYYTVHTSKAKTLSMHYNLLRVVNFWGIRGKPYPESERYILVTPKKQRIHKNTSPTNEEKAYTKRKSALTKCA